MIEEAEEYNPYLYATGGPRRKIDYSQPEVDNNDEVMFDETLGKQEKVEYSGDSYKVKHNNERFALYPKQ